jgi:thiamine-phosphate pyrophosphorylase
LSLAGLMVVTDRRAIEGDIRAVVGAAVEGGATAIQLREKDLSARELLELAQSLRTITREHGALLIINDRVDVALAAEADGVHLGGRSMRPEDVRRVVGEGMRIGVSTHRPEEVARARAAGADYVVFGPVFSTPSKVGILEPRGLDGLAEAVTAGGGMSVLAIGGLDASRAGDAIRAGAAGVAVIRAVIAAEDAGAAADELVRAMASPAAE